MSADSGVDFPELWEQDPSPSVSACSTNVFGCVNCRLDHKNNDENNQQDQDDGSDDRAYNKHGNYKPNQQESTQ